MPATQSLDEQNGKRKPSAGGGLAKSASPAAKRRQHEQTQRHGVPPSFYDNLSRLWLTRRTLREFDRRTCQLDCLPQLGSVAVEALDVSKLKRFSRHGGPDLSLIRAVNQIHGE